MSQHPAEKERLTGEDLLAMGDRGPCELVDGKLVQMVPTGGQHARIESALGLELGLWARERKNGWVMVGEVGIYTRRDPDRVRGADIAFVSQERAPEGPPRGFLEVAPELVVEIVSPGDRWQEVQQKLEEYFEAGVGQVWMVAPDSREVLIYDSAEQIRRLTEEDVLKGEGILEGFELRIGDLFVG
jgi:Uma2 family endonuclease